VKTRVGISGAQPRDSTGNHESKDYQGNVHCLTATNQPLKKAEVLAINPVGKKDCIVLNSQIGDEASCPAQSHKVKKSQPDCSNAPFEKPLVGLYCFLPIRNYRKTGNPTAILYDILPKQMLPLSLLDLRPIKKRGLIFFKNREASDVIPGHSFHLQPRGKKDNNGGVPWAILGETT